MCVLVWFAHVCDCTRVIARVFALRGRVRVIARVLFGCLFVCCIVCLCVCLVGCSVVWLFDGLLVCFFGVVCALVCLFVFVCLFVCALARIAHPTQQLYQKNTRKSRTSINNGCQNEVPVLVFEASEVVLEASPCLCGVFWCFGVFQDTNITSKMDTGTTTIYKKLQTNVHNCSPQVQNITRPKYNIKSQQPQKTREFRPVFKVPR